MKKYLASFILALAFAAPAAAGETGETVTIALGGGAAIEMVKIKAGTFKMGSPDIETARCTLEGPQHEVTITGDYYLGRYEVTQEQWTKVTGSNPSVFQKGGNYPVDSVLLDDIRRPGGFLAKLNAMTGKSFRLPTEAEWEFACRAGAATRYYWGNDPKNELIGDYAWYDKNSGQATHPVGQKKPNAFGLYDMSGNVMEWCQDYLSEYSYDAIVDPAGPAATGEIVLTLGSAAGPETVIRGGSFTSEAAACRSASRAGGVQVRRYNFIGLRLALSGGR